MQGVSVVDFAMIHKIFSRYIAYKKRLQTDRGTDSTAVLLVANKYTIRRINVMRINGG